MTEPQGVSEQIWIELALKIPDALKFIHVHLPSRVVASDSFLGIRFTLFMKKLAECLLPDLSGEFTNLLQEPLVFCGLAAVSLSVGQKTSPLRHVQEDSTDFKCV